MVKKKMIPIREQDIQGGRVTFSLICKTLDCPEKMRKESREIKRLREADTFTRIQTLLPSCSIEMFR